MFLGNPKGKPKKEPTISRVQWEPWIEKPLFYLSVGGPWAWWGFRGSGSTQNPPAPSASSSSYPAVRGTGLGQLGTMQLGSV